jgi:hypothetical protein
MRMYIKELALDSVFQQVHGVDKTMETLRNRGIGFELVTLKELQLATLNVLTFVYILYSSCQCISDS